MQNIGWEMPDGKKGRLRPHPGALLRLLLVLADLVACSACEGFPLAQRWYLIVQKNRTEVPREYTPMPFAEFLALPALPDDYGSAEWDLARLYTGQAVSLEGYIAEVRRVKDGWNYGRPMEEGDIHVHLREQPQPHCFPGSGRGEQLVTEVTPHFQPPVTGWSEEALLRLCEQQARVRVSGWLLHDYAHLDGIGRWRASAWEIHPVTKIEVWESERQAWQPLP